MKIDKTECDLNDKQHTACLRHAGAARFAYNWGLSRKIAEYQAGRKPALPLTSIGN
jgi:putative transposase